MRSGILFPPGTETFLFFTASRVALTPNQPSTQWELGASSSGVKGPGRESDNSPPTHVVKMRAAVCLPM
jgi:hypothetical protein